MTNIQFIKSFNILIKKLKQNNSITINNSNHINILKTGVYVINLATYFPYKCHYALFINNNPKISTLKLSEDGTICIHEILKLNKNDIITIKEYNLKPLLYKNINLNLWLLHNKE